MRAFEFHAYKGDEYGAIAERADITTLNFDEKAGAVAYGGRLAKRVKGPVDIAFAGTQAWADRYITTASPSEYHATGFRFGRLEA